MKQLFKTNVLLLFPETYDDLAVPLLPLHANPEDDDIDDEANLRALVTGGGGNSGRSAEPSKLKSPKKGGRKVDGRYSLVPDVVLELEQSDAANERGHVVIAIENPNPDLDVKLVVRSSCWQVLTLLFT